MTTGYSLVSLPVPQQKLVHVYMDAAELGRVWAGRRNCCLDGELATAAKDMEATIPERRTGGFESQSRVYRQS